MSAENWRIAAVGKASTHLVIAVEGKYRVFFSSVFSLLIVLNWKLHKCLSVLSGIVIQWNTSQK